MKTIGISGFSSDKARAKFFATYQDTFDRLWPVERETLDLSTAFGTARVYRSGRPDGIPIVLLPGGGGNALMWYRYVARLGKTRPVIALDPVGEPGGAIQDKPITDGRDLARALDDVLTALHIDRAHLVGCSYGGWAALQHAIYFPGRAATITLVDPGGLAKLNARFMIWVIAGGLAALAPAPLRRRAAGWLNNATLLEDDLMRLMAATMTFRRRLPVPAVLSDDDLRAVTARTLALFGERSQLYDAHQAAIRIQTLLPAACAEVVPGASHDVAMYCPDLVQDRIIDFVETADTRPDTTG